MRAVPRKELMIPFAIVFAGIVIAIAVYQLRIEHAVVHGTGTPEAVRPVSPTDHIIGNPSAPVAIVEYGDIDGSYSKSFQLTMEQLMTEYADGGKVAWVYRHFPVASEHPDSATHALAAECAASLSKPVTFFRFIDALQTAAPGDNQFDPANYPVVLGQFGIDEAGFRNCMANETYTKRVHADYDNALASGATGSPFIVLLVAGQKPAIINGALPYAAMKKLIDDSIAHTAS